MKKTLLRFDAPAVQQHLIHSREASTCASSLEETLTQNQNGSLTGNGEATQGHQERSGLAEIDDDPQWGLYLRKERQPPTRRPYLISNAALGQHPGLPDPTYAQIYGPALEPLSFTRLIIPRWFINRRAESIFTVKVIWSEDGVRHVTPQVGVPKRGSLHRAGGERRARRTRAG
jgi:hypothetical protein